MLRNRTARRPVSRVLSAPVPLKGSAWDGHSSGTRLATRLSRPTRAAGRDIPGLRLPPLFGLAPGGVYPAAAVTGSAVRSYRTVSPLPAAGARLAVGSGAGGLFSVALSLGSPPPDVIRHRRPVEPGLSSNTASCISGRPAVWHRGCSSARRPRLGACRGLPSRQVQPPGGGKREQQAGNLHGLAQQAAGQFR